jgi:hypothetical protein
MSSSSLPNRRWSGAGEVNTTAVAIKVYFPYDCLTLSRGSIVPFLTGDSGLRSLRTFDPLPVSLLYLTLTVISD